MERIIILLLLEHIIVIDRKALSSKTLQQNIWKSLDSSVRIVKL